MSTKATTSLAGVATPLSQDTSDFPACVAWFRHNEGTGTECADFMGNLQPLDFQRNGAGGNEWGTVRAYTSSDAVSDEAWLERQIDATDSALLSLGATGKIIIESDLLIPAAPSHSLGVFEAGQSESAHKGYMIAVDSGMKPILRMLTDINTGSSDSSFGSSGTPMRAVPTNERFRLITVIDNEAQAVTCYSEGSLNNVFVDTGGDYNWGPITLKIATLYVGLKIGKRLAANRYADATFYNTRIWTPSHLDNITEFVEETHRFTSDEFPPCMKDVT